MPNKTVFLHCHIFKNGGTTIDDMLKRNFGRAAIFKESADGQFLSSKGIINCIENTVPEKFMSISSHKLGLPVPKHKSIKFIPLVMIREPLDRLGSMYSFYNRQRQNISHECILAQQNSFKEFVEILLESRVDSSFGNIQAQFFLGNYFPPKYPSEETWATLVKNLNDTPCVGILERFDDSMILWEEYLRVYYPGIDLAYSRENISLNRSENLADRLNELKSELGSGLVIEFKKRNEFDYRLYYLVKKRIEQAVCALSNFTEKQKLFKSKVMELVTKAIGEKKNNDVGRGGIKTGRDVENVICYGQGGMLQCARIPLERDIVSSTSIHIVGCGMFNCDSGCGFTTVKHGQKVEIVLVVEAMEVIERPIVGITIKNDNNYIMFVMNSFCAKAEITAPEVGVLNSYSFVFKIPSLNSGIYSITPAFARGTQGNHEPLSCVENAFVFVVPKMISRRLPGVLYVDDFEVHKNRF